MQDLKSRHVIIAWSITNHHLGFLSALFLASVPRPLAPLAPCNSVNFFLEYLLVSASSTSSSTSVRLRYERGRLSELAVPKGVLDGTMVPIYHLKSIIRGTSGEDGHWEELTAKNFGSPLIPLPSPSSLR